MEGFRLCTELSTGQQKKEIVRSRDRTSSELIRSGLTAGSWRSSLYRKSWGRGAAVRNSMRDVVESSQAKGGDPGQGGGKRSKDAKEVGKKKLQRQNIVSSGSV